MTNFDSASQRLEKSLERLECAVASRLSRADAAATEGRDAAERSRAATSAAESRAASLAEANRAVARRLDDTIGRITRLLEG